jgi:hypothetical protein
LVSIFRGKQTPQNFIGISCGNSVEKLGKPMFLLDNHREIQRENTENGFQKNFIRNHM